MFDTAIVGGGPAGLSAALVLGRSRRRVVVYDAGRGRNFAAHTSWNFLTRDGTHPEEFRRLGREQASKYGVEFRDATVVRAERCVCPDGPSPSPEHPRFRICADDGSAAESRTLLLATGVTDMLPDIPGLAELYGCGVHHCQYCDGHSYCDRPLVAYGPAKKALGLALSLRNWSRDVTILTDGPARLSPADTQRRTRLGLAMRTERIARLHAEDGRLAAVVFENGETLACAGFFFNTGQIQRSPLAEGLGCELDRNGGIRTDRRQRTCVPGLYLAGDADKEVQFVIVAAAQGATAAVAINRQLQDEDNGEGRPDSAWRPKMVKADY